MPSELNLDMKKWRYLVTAEGCQATPIQRLVLMVLFDFWLASPTGEIFPSQQKLAARTGLSERSVRDNIKALEDQGWLATKDRGNGQGWRRHRYIPKWPRGFDPEKDAWLTDVKRRRDESREAHREAEGWGEYR
jgi:hypothetical protein